MTLKVNFSATKLNFLTAAILVSILSCVYTGDFVCQCDKGAKNGDTFIGVWNSPTGGCQKNFSVKIDLEDYKIRGNPHQTWNGKEVVVFYNAQLGYYPYFTNADGTRSYNGGMPQLVDINTHLQKSTRDIIVRIPDPNFHGLAVIDWEGWRPTWHRNWDSKKIYQTRSIEILRQRFPGWPLKHLVEQARKHFEDSARVMMLETLKLGKHLRPHAKWGFYGFPDCYGNDKTNFRCSDEVKRQNDELSWMFSTSTALFPSIYLPERSSTNRELVRGRLVEALRLSNIYKQTDTATPIYPYFRMIYEKKPLYYEFLTDADLRNTIGQAGEIGASGIVMWGNRRDENTSPYICSQISSYIHTKLGPYFMATQQHSNQCSNKKCNGNGRCVNTEWTGVMDFEHNNTCTGTTRQSKEYLENMLEKEKQVIGVSSTGETKVINIKQFKNKLKGLKKTLAKMEAKTLKQEKELYGDSRSNNTMKIKQKDRTKAKEDKKITNIKINNTKGTKSEFVQLVKTEKIPFLDVDFNEDGQRTRHPSNESASTREEIPEETIYCNKTESGTTKCMLVRRHSSMKLSKHNGFQIPQIYAILISISLGGAFVLSTVYIGTYYYFNVYKKKQNS